MLKLTRGTVTLAVNRPAASAVTEHSSVSRPQRRKQLRDPGLAARVRQARRPQFGGHLRQGGGHRAVLLGQALRSAPARARVWRRLHHSR